MIAKNNYQVIRPDVKFVIVCLGMNTPRQYI